MRTRSQTLAGITCAAVLVMGALTACAPAPNSGRSPGSDEAAQRSRQQHPSTATPPPVSNARPHPAQTTDLSPHPYVGMWVTADGHIRRELLPNGRYDEARGNRQSAYTGRYTVTGNHLDYVDDTGFTATGDVRDGVLHHEHLVLYREGDPREV